MKKGVILDVNSDHLIVMTKSGEFVKARKLNNSYSIGEEISFQAYSSFLEKFKFPSFSLKVATTFALIFILFFAQFSLFSHSNEVYAYMSIDINPSMELSINEDMEVIEIKPFNDEAIILLENIGDWKYKNVKEIMQQIVSLSEEKGYLVEGKVLIATTYLIPEEKKRSVIEKTIKEVEKEEQLSITSLEVTIEEHEESEELNISAGKYLKENILLEIEEPSKDKPKEDPIRGVEEKFNSSKNEVNVEDDNKGNSSNKEVNQTSKKENNPAKKPNTNEGKLPNSNNNKAKNNSKDSSSSNNSMKSNSNKEEQTSNNENSKNNPVLEQNGNSHNNKENSNQKENKSNGNNGNQDNGNSNNQDNGNGNDNNQGNQNSNNQNNENNGNQGNENSNK